MSILKALQKKQAEDASGNRPAVRPGRVVPFDKSARPANQPPDILADENIKIGMPNLAFNGQSDSVIGKALPDLETSKSAGATLNAGGPARSALPLPEFASWTVEPERVEPRLVTITHPRSSYCEEYRSLRTHILHKSQNRKLQSIVIASINASEGKSITALNFSWLLAQTDGVRALIIDSDLRRPSLTDYLGIETDRGLSEILSEKATLDESIIRLEPAGLHLLPGGEARSDVAELISGPKFREILRQAREMFDYVIIDAPPLGIFTDAAVLINHADGAMLVIRAGKTRYSVIDRVLEQVPRDRMLGVVLNQSEDVMEETHYNYGHYKRQPVK
jgi:protein-tyrosine kinase